MATRGGVMGGACPKRVGVHGRDSHRGLRPRGRELPAAERPRRFRVRRPPGLRARICHLGFCAAPQLRGPAGLGFAAPQLRGLAVERPREGHRGLCPRGRGLSAAERPRRFRSRRPPGLRARVCHLGFCAAPQLRGPAGLGFAAPQLRGLAVERPREGHRGLCPRGRGLSAAERPRRFRA